MPESSLLRVRSSCSAPFDRLARLNEILAPALVSLTDVTALGSSVGRQASLQPEQDRAGQPTRMTDE